jgi:hypothetical protein
MTFSRFVVYMHKIETLTYFFSGVINTTLMCEISTGFASAWEIGH